LARGWGPTAGLCEFVRGGAPQSQSRLPASWADPWPADEIVIGGHRVVTVALLASASFRRGSATGSRFRTARSSMARSALIGNAIDDVCPSSIALAYQWRAGDRHTRSANSLGANRPYAPGFGAYAPGSVRGFLGQWGGSCGCSSGLVGRCSSLCVSGLAGCSSREASGRAGGCSSWLGGSARPDWGC
jgi:hypothetical protein